MLDNMEEDTVRPTSSASFDWDRYLERTGNEAADIVCFRHHFFATRHCAEALIDKGKFVAVEQVKENATTRRKAKVLFVVGTLLRLRWSAAAQQSQHEGTGEGVKDRCEDHVDFWCDISEVCPWNEAENVERSDDQAVVDEYSNTLLRSSDESEAVGNARLALCDLLKVGCFVELQDCRWPITVFVCEILANFSGLLKLKLLNSAADGESNERWLHCTSEFVHPVGWCKGRDGKRLGCQYGHCEEMEKILETAKTTPAHSAVLAAKRKIIRHHQFQVGMKLEMVEPSTRDRFVPATVCELLNKFYVKVSVDTNMPPSGSCPNAAPCVNHTAVYHRGSKEILPVYWCHKNGVRLMPPKGYSTDPTQSFKWHAYDMKVRQSLCADNKSEQQDLTKLDQDEQQKFSQQQACSVVTRPNTFSYTNGELFYEPDDDDGGNLFKLGQKLEVFLKGFLSDEKPPVDFASATVTKVTGQYVWVHRDDTFLAAPSLVFYHRSDLFYPCGFAQQFGFSFGPPIDYGQFCKDIDLIMPPSVVDSSFSVDMSTAASSERVGDDEIRQKVTNVGDLRSENELSQNQTLVESRHRWLMRYRDTVPIPAFFGNATPYMPTHWLPGPNTPWCPKLFVNSCCFSGPCFQPDMLLQWLPKEIGPGPLKLVLAFLLSRLWCCSYTSKEVQDRILQSASWKLNSSYHDSDDEIESDDVISIKQNKRRMTCSTRICRRSVDVPDFLAQLLFRFDACPFFVSLKPIPEVEQCPAGCRNHLAHLPFLVPIKPLYRTAVSRRVGGGGGGGGPKTRAAVSTRFRTANAVAALRRRRLSIMSGRGNDENAAPKKRKIMKKWPQLPPCEKPKTRAIERKNYRALNSPDQSPRPTDRIRRVRRAATFVTSASQEQRDLFGDVRAKKCRPVGVSKPFPQVTKPAVVDADGNHEKPGSTASTVPKISSNPNDWSVDQLADWLLGTDVEFMCPKLAEEAIDGQAFMLLTLQDCMHYLDMKLGPALKLCELIKTTKTAFLTRFAD